MPKKTAKKATKKTAKKTPKKAAKKTTKKAGKKVAKKATKKTPVTHEEISRLAYLNYLHRIENGRDGNEESDWVAAEQSLK